MKKIMKQFSVLLMLASAIAFAEVPRKAPAPYEGLPGGLADFMLNGGMQQLMPSYCVFWKQGDGGICQTYFMNIYRNLTTGGSPKQAYCQNLQQQINYPIPCTGQYESISQCNQFNEQSRIEAQQNYANYCQN